jgi:hypothetical protein
MNKSDVYLVHHGHTQSLFGISIRGGVKHPLCYPLKQQSQTNMVDTPHDSSHNIHCKHVQTMANDGSTWPFTCER